MHYIKKNKLLYVVSFLIIVLTLITVVYFTLKNKNKYNHNYQAKQFYEFYKNEMYERVKSLDDDFFYLGKHRDIDNKDDEFSFEFRSILYKNILILDPGLYGYTEKYTYRTNGSPISRSYFKENIRYIFSNDIEAVRDWIGSDETSSLASEILYDNLQYINQGIVDIYEENIKNGNSYSDGFFDVIEFIEENTLVLKVKSEVLNREGTGK